jgi:predicted acetyltransferase
VSIEYRPVTLEEFAEFQRANSRAFGYHPTPIEEGAEPSYLKLFEFDRSIAGIDNGNIVATSGIYSFEMTVPGGMLPTAGVTWVGVQASHRRRGILTGMMRGELDDIRQRREPLAALWASESIIYGRFGYGLAILQEEWSIEREHTRFAQPLEPRGQVRFVTKEEGAELAPAVWDDIRKVRPGFTNRSEPWWARLFGLDPNPRPEMKDNFYVVYETTDGVEGYAIYKMGGDMEDGLPRGLVDIVELMGATDEASAALWQFCFGVDLIDTIKAHRRPLDDPLPWMLADPRRLVRKVYDAYWVRVVDVPSALAGRRYSQDGRLALRVHDAFCDWNEGVYELEGGPAGAECQRANSSPDVTLSAADLGALYMGGNTATALLHAGRIEESTPGAVARMDSMFRWSPGPWGAQAF